MTEEEVGDRRRDWRVVSLEIGPWLWDRRETGGSGWDRI